MSILTLLGIAVGLAMDAFAVAIAAGLTLQKVTMRQSLRLAMHFGIFQAVMPVIGYFAGKSFAGGFNAYDHWVAFGLLVVLGGKMLYEAFTKDETQEKTDPTKGWRLVTLSVATSLDALAVGVTMALMQITIFTPAVIIGIVAFIFTILGIRGGSKLGEKWEHRAELIGGLVLIIIGVKILIDHCGLLG